MIYDKPSYRLSYLGSKFQQDYFEDITIAPSQSTIRRGIIRHNLTRKMQTRININQNPIEINEYLNGIALVSPFNVVDVDEMAASPEDFEEEHGWSPKGE